MSEASAYVYIDMGGSPRLVGRLWTNIRSGRESATFEYDESWISFEGRFSLEPALRVGPGPFYTSEDRSIFSALGDSAPDRWGRTLIARQERLAARMQGRQPRSLRELDYLLGVSDLTRSGALRFSLEEGGSFVADEEHGSVPPLVELPRLLSATEHVIAQTEDEDDLRILLAPGSSLGGARPKASVRDSNGTLLIAKFPAESDSYDIVRWESVALELASRAGIEVADWRLEDIGTREALLIRRFDRRSTTRIPFLSAMSMLDANERENRSYIEIADSLREHGAEAKSDLKALWRRVVFNILVNNTDDHLRNHGFLYVGNVGWKLAPAYDLTPVPLDIGPRVLSTAIGFDEDRTASLEIALAVAEYFGLEESEAREVAREVADAVTGWREAALSAGIERSEIDRLATAFEHEDLSLARSS